MLRERFGDLNIQVNDLDKEGGLQDAETVIPKLNLAK